MPKQVDPAEILARNPQVDPDRLERALEALRRLRDRGLRRKEYDLAPPFGGRRASVQDGARLEPRLGQLAEVRDAE
jgi:hypothetical protein